MATQEYSLRVINQRKHWKEGIKRLIEECEDAGAVAILKSFYEEVDKLKLPTVDAYQNKKYLEERALRPDPRDVDPEYNKKQRAGYNDKYREKARERDRKRRERKKKERCESC